MQRFTELKVWQRSHALVLDVYPRTNAFPNEERFGVVSQLRRAMVSVATNIAEGAKRRSSAEYARFLNIAEGSLSESEYLIFLSRDLGYLPQEIAEPILSEMAEVSRMLNSLRTKVEHEA